jgi:hypothetical protein
LAAASIGRSGTGGNPSSTPKNNGRETRKSYTASAQPLHSHCTATAQPLHSLCFPAEVRGHKGRQRRGTSARNAYYLGAQCMLPRHAMPTTSARNACYLGTQGLLPRRAMHATSARNACYLGAQCLLPRRAMPTTSARKAARYRYLGRLLSYFLLQFQEVVVQDSLWGGGRTRCASYENCENCGGMFPGEGKRKATLCERSHCLRASQHVSL